jgi:protein-tyrosine phosphatase
MIDISKITDYLYVGAKIGDENVEEIKVLKFDFIISMIGQMPIEEVYTKAPFKSLWLKTYDNFFRPPSVRKLMTGVEAALPVLEAGGKILVFCMQGRRRSVAMAAAILIAKGHTANEAMKMLREARTVADPGMWYIKWQIQKFERFWKAHQLRKEQPKVR